MKSGTPSNPVEMAAYDESRDFSGKSVRSACYAPFFSLELFPNGDAWACCANGRYILGNIQEQSLLEIWNGEKICGIREALANYDWSLGCTDCERTILRGGRPEAANYDWCRVDDLTWPRALALRLNNACNFACIMCSDQLSSAIRRDRSRLPPLPRVYGDPFFDELDRFLPHLEVIHFGGGEPTIIPEYYRIWDMIRSRGLDHIQMSLVTNASVWTKRFEEILESLSFINIVVSIDGSTKETFEMVRRRSDFETVLENLERFAASAKRVRVRGQHRRQSTFGVSYCLMPVNHHEMAEVFLLAENYGAEVTVGVVLDPIECSFLNLDPVEIRQAHARLMSDFENHHDRLSVLNRQRYQEAATTLLGIAEEVENGYRSTGERHPEEAQAALTPTRSVQPSIDGERVAGPGGGNRIAIIGRASSGPSRTQVEVDRRALAIQVFLEAAGHHVGLFATESPGCTVDESDRVESTVVVLDADEIALRIGAFAPDAVIVTSLQAMMAIGDLSRGLPIWFDLDKDLMTTKAEGASSHLHDSVAIKDWWRLVPMLDRGDRFSCANLHQRMVLLALLGFRNRLGANSDGSLVEILDPADHGAGMKTLHAWVCEPSRTREPC